MLLTAALFGNVISPCQGKGSSQVSGSARLGGDTQLGKELNSIVPISAWWALISKASAKISVGNDRAKEICCGKG